MKKNYVNFKLELRSLYIIKVELRCIYEKADTNLHQNLHKITENDKKVKETHITFSSQRISYIFFTV